MADEVSVLFKMEIDPKLRKCPFTYLGEQSYYQHEEQEVLFSAGTVFRIQSIDALDVDQWEIRLSLSEDTDEVLSYYTKKMRLLRRSAAMKRSCRGWPNSVSGFPTCLARRADQYRPLRAKRLSTATR